MVFLMPENLFCQKVYLFYSCSLTQNESGFITFLQILKHSIPLRCWITALYMLQGCTLNMDYQWFACQF